MEEQCIQQRETAILSLARQNISTDARWFEYPIRPSISSRSQESLSFMEKKAHNKITLKQLMYVRLYRVARKMWQHP